MSLSRYRKFKIVLRKNWCIQWTNIYYTILAVLTPLLYCFLILVLRLRMGVQLVPTTIRLELNLTREWNNLIVEINRRRVKIQKEVPDFKHNVYVPQLIIAYAPRSTVFDQVISDSEEALTGVELLGFPSCEELKDAMIKQNFLAGVCFEVELNKPDIHLKFIYPSELRIYNQTYIGFDWNTNYLFDNVEMDEERVHENAESGGNAYVKEGFAYIQYILERSFIRLLALVDEIPEVRIFQFPVKEHIYDKLDIFAQELLPALITFSFLTIAVYLVYFIVKEKEHDSDHIFRTLNIGSRIRYLAWFLQGFGYFSLSSILVIAALKIGGSSSLLDSCDYFVMVFLMIAYSAASSSFCLMIASFFRGATLAIYGISSLWFLTYCPRMIRKPFDGHKMSSDVFVFIFPNALLGEAFEHMLVFERVSYFGWNSLADSKVIDSPLTIGIIILILYCQSIVFAIVGLLVNLIKMKLRGKHSLLKILKTLKCWKRSRRRTPNIGSMMRSPVGGLYELVPEYKTLRVSVEKVNKKFDDTNVIKDLSLSLYDNEIFVIMGHNGCGKTTLLSMLAGLERPTNGHIYIDGVDVLDNIEEACSNMGICLSNMAAFEDLTVLDQLVFFCYARGLSKTEAKTEVFNYLEAMEMMNERLTLVRKLSLGRKEQLAVCCALIGNNNLVILDNLGDNFDIRARKLLWDLLKSQREHRLILMSSHLVYDIEAVADRVAYMSNGEIIAIGTPGILKNIYQQGSRMICYKGKHCKTELITEIVQKHFPGTYPDEDIGREVSYPLGDKSSEPFTSLLNELEENSYLLDIKGISIVDKGLGDLYHQMGTAQVAERSLRTATTFVPDKSYQTDVLDVRYSQNRNLFWNYLEAMWIKITRYRYRRMFISLSLVLLPIICIVIANYIAGRQFRRQQLQPILYTLHQYYKSRTLMIVRANISEDTERMAEQYRLSIHSISEDHNLIEPIGYETMHSFIIKMQESDGLFAPRYYLIGAAFTHFEVRAWYNNFAFHSIPLSLNLLHKAILRSYLNDETGISLCLDPLPSVTATCHALVEPSSVIENLSILIVVCCISLIWSAWTFFLVKEKQSRFKFHQRFCGLPVSIFWLTTLIKEIIDILLTSSIATAALVCLDYESAHTTKGWSFLLFVAGGLAVASVNNLLGLLIKHRQLAYATALGLSLFGSLAAWAVRSVNHEDYSTSALTIEPSEYPFLIFPMFGLTGALLKSYDAGEIIMICEDEDIRLMSVVYENCKKRPNCCELPDVWSFKTGVATELVTFFLISLIAWIIIIPLDYFDLNKSARPCKIASIPNDNYDKAFKDHEQHHANDESHITDDSVVYERIKIQTLPPRDFWDKAIICDRVGKDIGSKSVLHRFSLIVDRGECFSLLGTSGSGMTVLLQILIGEVGMSYGNVFIQCRSLKSSESRNMNRFVGYCAQHMPLMDEYTAADLLRIFCLIRGVPRKQVKQFSEALAQMCGFYSSLHKTSKQMSDGNKRRLCWAIAIIGNPSILYFDHPTTYVDPTGQRQFRSIVSHLCKRSKTVILATGSAKEAQCISDRVGVYYNGKLLCIGDPNELIAKYSDGYFIQAKIRHNYFVTATGSVMYRRTRSEDPMTKFVKFVEKHFPNAKLLDFQGDIVIVVIPCADTTMSEIIKKIDDNSYILMVEFFKVTRGSMEKFFLDFVKRSSETEGDSDLRPSI